MGVLEGVFVCVCVGGGGSGEPCLAHKQKESNFRTTQHGVVRVVSEV